VFKGVADIVIGEPEDLLPVGVWNIGPQDEVALDRYEGFPHLYRKETINGMMTYVMNRHGLRPPSGDYFNTILIGYEDFGLDTSALYAALDESELYAA
jgi:hypothetical protein